MEENKNKWTNKFRELGKNKGSTSDFRELYKDMENNKEKENKTPHRMSRIAFPKAKYGLFLAVALVLFVLIILYKDSIL